MKQSVYLSLGSNIRREINYPEAIRRLADLGRLEAVSMVYETDPVGMDGADDFFNGAALLLTDLEPEILKRRLIADIETPLERRRVAGETFASRTIDVDISLWNDDVLEIAGRPVPDPDILEHLHVAVPLAEIAGHLVHPIDGRTLAAIAEGLRRAGGIIPRPRPDIVLEI